MANNTVVARAISRNMYAGKVHKNRKQRRTKDKKLSLGNDGNANTENGEEEKLIDDAIGAEQTSTTEGVTEELSNGFVIFISILLKTVLCFSNMKVKINGSITSVVEHMDIRSIKCAIDGVC